MHPSNLAPALWALDASVHLLGPKGAKELPMADFFMSPDEDVRREVRVEDGEIITGVSFAPLADRSGSSYVEVREKESYDWALVNAAVRIDSADASVSDVRIIVSAVAPTPLRVTAAERLLKGQKVSEELAWKAGRAATEGAQPLSQNGYKVKLLEACVAHAVQTAWSRSLGR